MASDRGAHKMRVKLKDKVALVKVLIRHPMETGRRKDKVTGRTIPRHFIREIRCDYNGETVLSADWNWGVARNPYLSFRILEAESGGKVRIQWVDNLGKEDAIEAVLS